ncbi:YeiH family protein [Pseudoclavibacter sp. CFCC 14310]|uniref:YeiH family protein n=1 Tax=Pseudoclavibacter sp. CFCC 14310 TaxID=2615180 RepID=UPI001CE43091|nr:YeiH family protein [Pseudoclavibacter sp. CFCC 14310]
MRQVNDDQSNDQSNDQARAATIEPRQGGSLAQAQAQMAPVSWASRVGAVVPGLAVSAVGMGLALLVSSWLPVLSPMLVAIVLGVLLRNLGGVHRILEPGIASAAKRVLRIGVVLLGLQLVFGDVLALGPGMIVVVVAVVGVGIGSSLLVGRWLGMTPNQVLLIGGGFSICGAAAVAAIDGVLDDDRDEEVVTAVALVVIYGTVMIPLLPLMASGLGLTEQQTGLWAGASVHEVAQVVAVGGAVGSGALAAAVIVKLARVLLLAPVLTVIGLQRRLSASGKASAIDGTHTHRPPIMPLFVAGFIAMVVIRSLGIVPQPVVDVAHTAQTLLLTAAMFALGAGVKLSMIRRLGARPFVLALSTTVVVAAIGLGGVLLFG